MNADDLKSIAVQFGAELFGVAPISRFNDLDEEEHPNSIAPECQSVIVIGKRITRGSLRGVEEGTNFRSTYESFGYKYLEDNFLSQITYDLTLFLEQEGFEAVPLFGYHKDGMAKGKPVSSDKPAPNVIVDIDYAAQAAGLGTIGKGGFFISPIFGTRQRFAMILTDAKFEPNDVCTDKPCLDCDECVKACPFSAIDDNLLDRIKIEGSESQIAKIDYELCRKCPNGSVLLAGRGSRPDRIAAVCGRACLISLEKRDKCANMFRNDFRKRKPWLLDLQEKPIRK